MEEKKIIKITDNTRIKKITFKYPNLMSPYAENIIKEDYQYILDIKEELSEKRANVRHLEEEVKRLEQEFREKTSTCDIEFETYTKEYSTNDISLLIKGQGNDLIGTFNN